MKTSEMKKTGKANHYAIATFYPGLMTNTTLFFLRMGASLRMKRWNNISSGYSNTLD